MRILAALGGLILIASILVEGFETVVQPRRVTRKYRISRVYYITLWAAWRGIARSIFARSKRRSAFISIFGPLSLLGVFATWVACLLFGFALLHYGLHDPIRSGTGESLESFGTDLYLSGTTFFTLGYGDVTPTAPMGRLLAVIESGLGFGFLAAILSYLPVLFQAYAQREVSISLLDARAGSPPSAAQLILRSARGGRIQSLDAFLAEWERWCAQLLESQLSFPVLAYYRSQHDNQSWLAALTTILDTCAILMTQIDRINLYQAEITFAIARHAAVDLALVLRASHPPATEDRVAESDLRKLRDAMSAAEMVVTPRADFAPALRDVRATYEPFLDALASRLLLTVPPMIVLDSQPDNWQRSAWMKPTRGIGQLPVATPDESHFE